MLTPNNWSLIRVRDACQSYSPFDAVSPPFKHGSIRYGRTASAADRAVLVELRRFLAGIHATATPPCGRCPRSTSRRRSSTPSRSRPCGGRSKSWRGRSRSSAGKRHTWPRTTGRSPRRCAGAGSDAPAGARAGSWSEPLVVPGSGVGRRSRSGLRFSTLAGQVGGPVVHEPAPTLEQVRAPIRRLDLVPDHVR